jgi:hypothetical protein
MQSVAFRAQDDGGGRGEIDLIVIVIAAFVEAVDPVAGFFQFVDGAINVGHLYDWKVGERSGGGAGYGVGEARGAAFGNDYASCAGGVCSADDGSQIVRILDAV